MITSFKDMIHRLEKIANRVVDRFYGGDHGPFKETIRKTIDDYNLMVSYSNGNRKMVSHFIENTITDANLQLCMFVTIYLSIKSGNLNPKSEMLKKQSESIHEYFKTQRLVMIMNYTFLLMLRDQISLIEVVTLALKTLNRVMVLVPLGFTTLGNDKAIQAGTNSFASDLSSIGFDEDILLLVQWLTSEFIAQECARIEEKNKRLYAAKFISEKHFYH